MVPTYFRRCRILWICHTSWVCFRELGLMSTKKLLCNSTYPLSGYGVNDVMSSATHPSQDKRWTMLGISVLVGGKPVLSLGGVIDINFLDTSFSTSRGTSN